MKDYIEELEKEINDLDKLLQYCKLNNIENSIVFVIVALKRKKTDKYLNLIK